MNKMVLILILSLMRTHGAWAQANCSNQLEAGLAEMPEILSLARSNQEGLSRPCLKASMDTFFTWTTSVRAERATQGQPEIGHYGYCESATQKRANRSHIPPCQSEAYMNVIENAYNDVLTCLELDPKELFAITAVESGFHVNTLSLSGQDVGIGQLIPQAIEEVNGFWQDALGELSQSKNSACRNIRPWLEKMEPTPAGQTQTCAMMALPENPVRNLVYLGLLHKFHQQKMHTYFLQSQLPERLADLTQEPWTDEELIKLEDVLVFLAYNAGASGAQQAFEAFLAEKQASLTSWQQAYDQVYRQSITAYLEAMASAAAGDEGAANDKLQERELLLEDMELRRENRSQIKLEKSVFFAQPSPGSFGEFLVRSNTSMYLQILLDRIQYIEETLLKSPGLCAPEGFLKGR